MQTNIEYSRSSVRSTQHTPVSNRFLVEQKVPRPHCLCRGRKGLPNLKPLHFCFGTTSIEFLGQRTTATENKSQRFSLIPYQTTSTFTCQD